MIYFLDTNICAFTINGKFQHLTERFLNCQNNDINLSSVVLYELLYGAEKSQRRESNLLKIQTFISEIKIVPLDSKTAAIASKIRADLERIGTPIGGYDLLIAATAIANDSILVTNNTKEFARVTGLVIEDWTV